jgi:hypothetical protein
MQILTIGVLNYLFVGQRSLTYAIFIEFKDDLVFRNIPFVHV